MVELNSVQKFYKNKTLFVTGSSGFMGKVLLEKLLYSCSDVKEIMILMRPKRGKSEIQRVADFTKLPMFQRILDEKPSVLKKIVPVYGDLTKPGLALSDKHLDLVIESSEIVFHLAATLKLEATLKQAVEMNLVGTKNVVDVCKKMPKLIQMMHLSTAFCCSEYDVLEEKIYEWKWDNPKNLISSANLMSDETMQAMEITMLKTQPNTYTLTKRLTEIMMRDEFNNNFPVTIVRPSIVTPAYQEPMPGWVDSLNGPIGLMIGAAKGVIRSMLVDGELAAEVIPVDLAINALIMITKDVSTLNKKPIEIPVYNVTVSEKKKTKMSWVLETGKKINFDFPFEAGLWYPDGGITTNKFIHQFNVIFFHWLPAYFIDFLMLILGQKRFMIHVQNKVSQGLEVLQFFTMRNWNFKSDKMKEILKNMTPEEYDMFFIDSESVKDDYEYLKTSILGGRQYCLKEPLSSLPKARIQLRLMYCLDRFFKFMFLGLMIWGFLKITGLQPVVNEFFESLSNIEYVQV